MDALERVYGQIDWKAKDYQVDEKEKAKHAREVLKRVERILKPWLKRLGVPTKVRHDQSKISESQYLEVFWKPDYEPPVRLANRHVPKGWHFLLKVRVSYHYIPGTAPVAYDERSREVNIVLPMEDKAIADALKRLLVQVRRTVNEWEKQAKRQAKSLLQMTIAQLKRQVKDMEKPGAPYDKASIAKAKAMLSDYESRLKSMKEATTAPLKFPSKLPVFRSTSSRGGGESIAKAIQSILEPWLINHKAFIVPSKKGRHVVLNIYQHTKDAYPGRPKGWKPVGVVLVGGDVKTLGIRGDVLSIPIPSGENSWMPHLKKFVRLLNNNLKRSKEKTPSYHYEAQAIAIAVPYPGITLDIPRELVSKEDIEKVKKAIKKYFLPYAKKWGKAKDIGRKALTKMNLAFSKALSKVHLDTDTAEEIAHLFDIATHSAHMFASKRPKPMKTKRDLHEAADVKKMASLVANQLDISVQELQRMLKQSKDLLATWGRIVIKTKPGKEKEAAQRFLNQILLATERKDKKRKGVRVFTESSSPINPFDPDRFFGHNGTYRPNRKPKIYRSLPPGVYEAGMDLQGPYFQEMKVNTDALLKFEDTRQEEVVNEVRKFWSLRERYDKLGFRHVRGILLYGAPGVGKTCLLNRLMFENRDDEHIVLYSKCSPSVLPTVLNSLRKVESERPVLVIMEDIDDLVRYDERSLLNLFDGGDTVNHVCYVATTNYIESFPPRMLRPGRFDRKVQILPPPKEGRIAYLQSKLGLEEDDGRMDEYLDLTDGFTFSQLKEFVIATECMEEDPETVAKRIRLGLEH